MNSTATRNLTTGSSSRWAAGALATAVMLSCLSLPAGLAQAQSAQVEITPEVVRLTSAVEGAALVFVQRDPFLLSIARSTRGRDPEPVAAGGSIRYRVGNDATWHAIARVLAVDRRAGGVQLRCETDAGKRATVSYALASPTQVTCEITLDDQTAAWIEQRFACSEAEHFYGLGDVWRTRSVDLRGKRVRMWVRDGTPDECSYVPFFISTAGYGAWFAEPRDGYFDFGQGEPGTVAVQFRTQRLRWHLFVGSSPFSILRQYLTETGLPPAVPDWTLGCQHWWNEHNERQIREHTRMFLDHEIPLSAVWIDRPWMLGADGSQDFIFDPQRFPQAQDLIDWFHANGLRVMVWACDYMTPDSRDYAEARDKGYLLTPGGRSVFDFSTAEAREWWKGRVKRVLDMGIDGIKLDRGQSVPGNAKFANGLSGEEMHNYHGYFMVKTYWEALREARGDDFQLTPRAGWVGTQAMSVKWPGDLDDGFSLDAGLGAAIVAQQTAAATGFAFWGSDIGGFGGRPSKECYLRWLEFGCFSPLMQICSKGDPARPFGYDQEAIAITRSYAKLRQALLPYLREAARQAHQEGVPMVRPLGLVYPSDERAHEQAYEYMFGDALLVAPVYQPGNEREVYLPAGEWTDFWDAGKTYRGPADLTLEVPLDRIPVFLKAGCRHPLETMSEEDDR